MLKVEDERATALLDHPLVLAHDSELSRPREFVTRRVADSQILLVRDQMNELRAFINICRHREATLAHATRGGCDEFECPYHGWVYSLRGELAHVPGEEFLPPLNRAELALTPLPVTRAHGFLWVVPGGARDTTGLSIDMSEFLGAIDDDLHGHGLSSLELEQRSEGVYDGDWRTLLAQLSEPLSSSVASRAMHVEQIGRHVRSVTARGGAQGDAGVGAIASYAVFPNTVIVVEPEHISLLSMAPFAVRQTAYTLYKMTAG